MHFGKTNEALAPFILSKKKNINIGRTMQAILRSFEVPIMLQNIFFLKKYITAKASRYPCCSLQACRAMQRKKTTIWLILRMVQR